MSRKLARITAVIAATVGLPAAAQEFNVLLGGRATESATSAAYMSVTGDFAPAGTNGFLLRGEIESSTTEFAGARTNQDTQRLVLGYSFATDIGEFTALVGPTHVSRSLSGGPTLFSETGYYVGLEGYGFFGDRGYWAGIAQYSSPDEAFYTRAFATYLVAANIGPDVSYLHEPNFERATLGLRSAWTFEKSVVAVIAGVSRESGMAGPNETEGFLELQLSFSF